MPWGKLLISMVLVRKLLGEHVSNAVWNLVSVEFSSYRQIFMIGRDGLRLDLYNDSAGFCWRWRQRYAGIRK
jgi:hypothetical protein